VTWCSSIASRSADCVFGVDRHADDVRRQHVARELDALEVQSHGPGEHMGEGGLAHAGQVFDQQVAAREQAREGEPDLRLLAEDDAARRLDHALDRPAQRGLGRQLGSLQEHASIVLDAI
jgi:hypothetical protein